MVKRFFKKTVLGILALSLVIALGFGFGYTTQKSSSGKDNLTVSVEGVQAGLSWPFFVVQAVSSRSG